MVRSSLLAGGLRRTMRRNSCLAVASSRLRLLRPLCSLSLPMADWMCSIENATRTSSPIAVESSSCSGPMHAANHSVPSKVRVPLSMSKVPMRLRLLLPLTLASTWSCLLSLPKISKSSLNCLAVLRLKNLIRTPPFRPWSK